MATFRKRGDRWQVSVRRNGHPCRYRSFLHRQDAERWARSVELGIDRSALPSDPRLLSKVTLRDLVLRYISSVTVQKKRRHIEEIELRAFLRHPICAKRVSELQTSDFAAYRDLRLQSIKPTSLKRSLSPIRHLFEVARHEWGLPISQNPLKDLALKAPDNRRQRRLQTGEYERLVLSAKKARNSYVFPIIRLALATAMRRGEILAIRPEHVDLANRGLLIPDSKNGLSRTIPLTEEALDILRSHMNTASTVFPMKANAFQLSWQRVKRRAGLHDFRFHDLRHEAISRFFERGLTPPEVALISGHRDMRMLFRYSHAMHATVLRKLEIPINSGL